MDPEEQAGQEDPGRLGRTLGERHRQDAPLRRAKLETDHGSDRLEPARRLLAPERAERRDGEERGRECHEVRPRLTPGRRTGRIGGAEYALQDEIRLARLLYRQLRHRRAPGEEPAFGRHLRICEIA